MLQSKNLKFILLFVLAIGSTACKKNKAIADLSDPQQQEEEVIEQKEPEVLEIQVEERQKERVPLKGELKLTTKQKLNKYFDGITNAASTNAANGSISEALSLFSSPDAPMLIVIYEANGKASYDEPTTIEKYLNYLKDTKNNSARVEEIITDTNGKIKEIVLKK